MAPARIEPGARGPLVTDQQPQFVARCEQRQRAVGADETRRSGAEDLHAVPIRKAASDASSAIVIARRSAE
jgi:hypothetical protein